MQEIIACVDNFKFDVETAIDLQLGTQPLPFPGMDKSGSAICTFFLRSICNKAGACPFRHVKGDRTVVCKHWLRGLCKKGDDCEFLHEYDMSKMPECYFYSKFAECSNKECPFLHIDPNAKIKDCPWYDRGFCRHGPNCKNRHVRRLLCPCYINGFCLEGAGCKFMHPKYDLPIIDATTQAKKASIVCHYCGEYGHKALNCPSLPMTMKSDYQQGLAYNREHYRKPERLGYGAVRNLDDVTCFKCGEKGHYANKCTKSHLAFLKT